MWVFSLFDNKSLSTSSCPKRRIIYVKIDRDYIAKICLDFFFPPLCLNCNSPGGWLCSKCKNLYLRDAIPECAGCRKISSEYATHKDCISKFPLNRVIVCWKYNFLSKLLMSQFKYKYRYRTIEYFLEMALEKAKLIKEDAILVPVPSHENTVKDRGFNQTEIIAEFFGKHLNMPMKKALSKTKLTRHQAGTSREERLKMDQDLYELNVIEKDEISNRHVVIIDDVCTTGTTLIRCANALGSAKPASISAFVLFRGKKLVRRAAITSATTIATT